MPSLTIEEVLRKCIAREIQSQVLYKDLASRVRISATEYALSLLIHQEEEHQRILESYLAGNLSEGALGLRHVVDYKLAEHLEQPDVCPDMQLPEIFLLAAHRERESHDLYTELADIHPEGKLKQLLFKLASEELGHKQKVEIMYSEVAFPQTDGG